jgi:hypothetical protein
LKLRDLLRINEKLQPFSFIEGRKKFQLLESSGGEIKKIREKKKRKIFGRWTHIRALSFPHATLKGYYRHDDFNNIKKSYNQSLEEIAHSSQIKLFF